MRIAVFGSGPAGLVAAHAALHSGADSVTIYTRKILPSTQYGCQYLHAPIPGYRSVARTTVDYRLVGTPEQYRAKVYGGKWLGEDGRVSPEDFVGKHEAWDIRETYRLLWARMIVSPKVEWVEQLIDATWLEDRALYKGMTGTAFAAYISTIPAAFICKGGHTFKNHTIYAIGDTKPSSATGNNQIVCDGTTDHEWYRDSNVFGYNTTEWASPRRPQGVRVAEVYKPLTTDCDCFPAITRMGRYGEWKKSVLVHHVFAQTISLMEKLRAK